MFHQIVINTMQDSSKLQKNYYNSGLGNKLVLIFAIFFVRI
jgi:hypothetical protein